MTVRTTVSAYSEPSETVLRLLRSDVNGLSRIEAKNRLEKNGNNTLEFRRDRTAWQILAAQFGSIVVWLLAAAALVAVLTGEPIEALAIGVVLVLNAAIGFLIEWQASKALQALRRATPTTAHVRRDGHDELRDASTLVVGDIIVTTAGDRVPADARLIEARSVRSDESSLTGESAPVDKSAEPVDDGVALAERSSMVFLGTKIVSGRALAVVTATGTDTEFGRVGQLLQEAHETETPLERRLSQLGRRLVYLVLGVSLIVLLAGFLRGDDPWLMAKVSISLAVAAVPEGLPAVTTLILALGVLRMAKASAIVRRLAAVETLGSTTVICTDKTGTLTENRMTVRTIAMPSGRILQFGEPRRATAAALSLDDLVVSRLLRVAVLCNEAALNQQTGEAIGDPTEAALLTAARDLGLDVGRERGRFASVVEAPFEAVRKRMTAIFDAGDKQFVAMMKGAPSVVLNASENFVDESGVVRQMTSEARKRFLEVNNEMANQGFRVLAFADRNVRTPTIEEADDGYTFLGLIGMSDPPRREVPAAIRQAREAGIRIVMLTGDQTLTAKAIASELQLAQADDVVSLHSNDLADLDDEQLAKVAARAHVFARVTPEDKLRIVRALQKDGEIVAVTGDGVNDAPALKQADIGVAMGMRGTDVAKESADLVLTDDNFSTIVRAVEGGRTIYANIIKFVHLMFSHNLGEILVIFVAILLYLPVPLLPLQILWINLVTDVFPAFALAVEPSTEETMRRRPRSARESFLSPRFMFLIAWQGALLASVTLAAYVWALNSYGEGRHARTVALLSLVGVEVGHLFNCRSRTRSAFDSFFSNPFVFLATATVIALQLVAVFIPFLAGLLDLETPTTRDWIVIAMSVAVPVIVVEITKAIGRRARRVD